MEEFNLQSRVNLRKEEYIRSVFETILKYVTPNEAIEAIRDDIFNKKTSSSVTNLISKMVAAPMCGANFEPNTKEEINAYCVLLEEDWLNEIVNSDRYKSFNERHEIDSVIKKCNLLHKEVEMLRDEVFKLNTSLGELKSFYSNQLIGICERIDSINSQTLDKSLDVNFCDLDISTRTLNVLRASEICKVKDILGLNLKDVSRFRNFGRRSMQELLIVLEKFNIEVKDGNFIRFVV